MELDAAPRPWLGAHLRYGDSCGARGKRTGRVCAAAELWTGAALLKSRIWKKDTSKQQQFFTRLFHGIT